jgi:hypothetical protein
MVTKGEEALAGRRWWIPLGIVCGIFAAVRFGCLFNDLWLDEIWSLELLRDVHSPKEIFSELWYDNNHPLNSLFLYLLMPATSEWTYRLLAWATGAATIWLAGIIARRQYRLLHPQAATAEANASGLLTAVVFGGSYLLIHYSSEARGYAPAVCFGLLAYYSLLRAFDTAWSAWALVFWSSCVLSLLSHLIAIQIMLACLGWSIAKALFSNRDRRAGWLRLAWWHLPPWGFLWLYFLLFSRKTTVGGGLPRPLADVLGELAAFGLGFPRQVGVSLALPTLLGVVLVALFLLWRRDRPLTVFYALAISVSISGALLLPRTTPLFPRYFIVSCVGALFLLGYLLAWITATRRLPRSVVFIALGLFLVGNGAHTFRLIRDGRGQYQKALRYILAQTPTKTVTVGSDYDFRNSLVIDYYAKSAGPGRTIQYCASTPWPAQGMQWLFLHRLDGEAAPLRAIADKPGHPYRLEQVFPHAALSGWDWYVYRNLDLLPPPLASR